MPVLRKMVSKLLSLPHAKRKMPEDLAPNYQNSTKLFPVNFLTKHKIFIFHLHNYP